jgi:parallel beta-helix repeat protein
MVEVTYATITGCVLSGNARSGLFVTDSSPMTIENNRIGVEAHSDAPLPNGASGIYIGLPLNSSLIENYLTVAGNIVAFNRDFGIAVAPRRDYAPAQPDVRLTRNLVWANAIDAIDVGLDGVATPTIVSGQGPLVAPVITSARYDRASDTTTIEGDLPAAGGINAGRIYRLEVELFASETPGVRRTGDAQYFIDRADLRDEKGRAVKLPARFRLVVPRDLTGLWMTATLTSSHSDFERDDRGQTRIATTELSRPLLVSE